MVYFFNQQTLKITAFCKSQLLLRKIRTWKTGPAFCLAAASEWGGCCLSPGAPPPPRRPALPQSTACPVLSTVEPAATLWHILETIFFFFLEDGCFPVLYWSLPRIEEASGDPASSADSDQVSAECLCVFSCSVVSTLLRPHEW